MDYIHMIEVDDIKPCEITTDLDYMLDNVIMKILKEQPNSFDRIAITCKLRKDRIIVNYSKMIFAYIKDNSIPYNRIMNEISDNFDSNISVKHIEKLRKLDMSFKEIDKIFMYE
ncbi:unnamed protein product [Brachionus calyciflorus]|uniref:Uncharacterized protein n=1 Tax=Brachionus calyciflorus TaxID=104777 RepID=A0A814F8J0_9BILA|nr:unnamed protein product [Brachionus calyciflorus]